MHAHLMGCVPFLGDLKQLEKEQKLPQEVRKQ